MKLSTDKYEYMDEDAIDDKLKCIICAQPFQIPVILDCQHTFCEVCIDTWIKQNASCPICRRQVETNYVLTKITDLNICNQLDCLPVRCLQCQKNEIQRNRFKKHLKRCSKSRITILSDSIQSRFKNIKRTIRTKNNFLETPTPQRRVTLTVEPIQQQFTYRPPIQNRHLRNNEQQIYNSRLRPSTVRPNERNRNEIVRQQSKSIREQWEGFISSTIPNIRIFDFQYHYSGVMENFIRACYSGRSGSKFWTNKLWFFHNQRNDRRKADDGLFFSTNPYRRKTHEFYWEHDYNTRSYIEKDSFKSVKQISIHGTQTYMDRCVYFPNVNELTIHDCGSVSTSLNKILPLSQLNKLNILIKSDNALEHYFIKFINRDLYVWY
ncbi:unnamed protein product [Adineta steineri]|nr:unnamed protein product [Adineta steineri]